MPKPTPLCPGQNREGARQAGDDGVGDEGGALHLRDIHHCRHHHNQQAQPRNQTHLEKSKKLGQSRTKSRVGARQAGDDEVGYEGGALHLRDIQCRHHHHQQAQPRHQTHLESV